MHKKSLSQDLIIILIAIIPSIYLVVVWSSVPAIIATHYDIHFNPDKTGSRVTLWWLAGSMVFISLLVYFLLKNIHRIDPKRYQKEKQGIFIKIGIGCSVFISAFSLLLIMASTKNIHLLDHLLIPLMGLLFSFLGNYLQNIKPNYFAGFRLPWTLESELNWRKTHQFAAKIWFGGGLFIVLIGVLLPLKSGIYVMFCCLFIMAIIPIIYSYRFFKKEKSITSNQ